MFIQGCFKRPVKFGYRQLLRATGSDHRCTLFGRDASFFVHYYTKLTLLSALKQLVIFSEQTLISQNYLVSAVVFSFIHRFVSTLDEGFDSIIATQGADAQARSDFDGFHAVGYGMALN